MMAWRNPWQWPELLRVRRHMRIASTLMGIAIAGFIPAGWIVMVPTDPTLRPDLTQPFGWGLLAFCIFCLWLAHRTARNARARFDRAIYDITRKTRDTAAAQGLPVEIDLGETYPPILLSRQHRVIAVAAPVPLLVRMEQVHGLQTMNGSGYEAEAPREPHLAISLKHADAERVCVVPGRGLGRAGAEDIRGLGERITEFLEIGSSWGEEGGQAIDVAAFVASMRER